MGTEFEESETPPIIQELAKLIKLNGGKNPTTVAKFHETVDQHRLITYMSWDSNGELQIK